MYLVQQFNSEIMRTHHHIQLETECTNVGREVNKVSGVDSPDTIHQSQTHFYYIYSKPTMRIV